MRAEDYLERIGHAGPRGVDGETLAALHEAHLLTVPFENIDIHRRRPIALDEERILAKVVRERRGGFCYELNGAFAWLLRSLGFRVELLSAKVAREDGSWGPEFDHLALRVPIGRETWLVDVGFGDSYLRPLRLDVAGDQRDPTGAYRLLASEGRLVLERSIDDSWRPQYSISPATRPFEAFAGMCEHHQTSPESHFTRKRVASLATREGRVTLRDDRLIETRGGERRETPISPEEWGGILRERFGIT